MKNHQHLPKNGNVLDFGDQLLFNAKHASSIFPEFQKNCEDLNQYDQVTEIYRLLGLNKRDCADYKENATVRINLNYTIRAIPELESKYDLVTNQGFSEHVFNQASAFEAFHYACKPGGIILHVLPCQGWADGGGWGHGFYQYQPNFFKCLAKSNSYETISMMLSPFSPDPFICEFNPNNYAAFVNSHLTNEDYKRENHLGGSIFASIIVMLRVPSKKIDFVMPHE